MRLLTFITVTLALSFFDILYTFYNVRILKEHKKTHWEDTEYNPLVRTSWHIFGFLNGTRVAGFITLVAVAILCFLIGEREFLQGLVIGAYMMLHYFHYLNYAYISKRYIKDRKKASLLEKLVIEH